MVETGAFEGLAAVPPGPELSALLGGVDLARVPGDRVVDLLRAQSRQSAHEQARLWAALVAVGLAVPDEPGDASSRAAEVADWAPGEVAAALTWTHRTAERELRLAEVVVRELPEVFTALWAGHIDRGKAVVFAEYLDPAYGITAEQAAALVARLLPAAPGLTTGQLRGRLWRALLAIDPGWARRRYVRAVRARAVTALLGDDGTVTITGSGLPVDEAAAACARVDRLAEAAKRAGHSGRVGQIAADVFLGLLDGRFHGRSEDEIIAGLLRERRPEDGPDDGPAATDNAALDATATATADTITATCIAGNDTAGNDTAGNDTAGNDTAGNDTAGNDTAGNDTAADAAGEETATGTAAAAPAAEVADTLPGPVDPGAGEPARTGIEIRVGLTTLLGLDERPGEIPGLGPVLAPVARAVVAAQVRGAEWRFAVTDPAGCLLLAGVTRRRPRSPGAPDEVSARRRGGIVELQVSAVQLRRLVAVGVTPEWTGVIADIAGQFGRRDGLLAALDDRPADRFAHTALARHIEVRDRTCSHPGCRHPARRSELDHTRDHARGGATVAANLGPGCRRHHTFKHELGWRLTQPEPGVFVWTSPLGQVYRTRGEPITPPLPHPLPRPDEPPETDGRWYDGPILRRPDQPPRTEARPPPAVPDDPPPF